MAGEDQAKFAVVLEDKTSGAVASAADALEKLRGSIKSDVKELAAMQSALKRLQQGAVVDVAAFRELQGRIEAQKSKISAAEAKFVSLGGKFGETKEKARGAKDKLKDLSDTMGKLPGPIGKIGGSLSGVIAKLGTGGILALAIGAAFVALGAAAIGAAGALAVFGVQAANARRNQELHFEAISRMRRGLVGMRASAGEVMGAIDQVAGSTATSREQVARFAEILQRGGVRGANLTTALRAASIKAAALGDEAGASFAQLAVGASRAGVSINRLADDVQARFGGVAARKLLDLNVISEKLHESWSGLFDGLNLEPLLGPVREITQLFSQNTATGRALKQIVTALFQPMIDSAGDATPAVKRFFQGIVIAALRVTIVILRIRNWFRDTFSGSALSGISGMKAALAAGMTAFALFAGAVLVTVGALALLVAPFVVLAAAGYLVAKGIDAAYQAIRSKISEWGSLGSRLIEGLIGGIRRGRDSLIRHVRELASSVTGVFRDVLQIRSPSRVFADLGRQIPAGLTVGVEAGAPRADAAVAGMLDFQAPQMDAAGLGLDLPTSIAAPAARAPISVSVGDIYVSGNTTAEQAEDLRAQVARIFEGLALTMGGSRV